ncbi:ABC transporter substrate-binding protein [Dethiothermospora halolimnae]|uniref:ABC transporter substrate-binding protein n=1 Tax=Dethiothermospora halolimnae TaxID=3114390 RepID=UPI003CCC1767
MKKIILAMLVISLLFITVACGSDESDDNEISIGYFPNLSHGPAMVGIEKGFIEDELKDNSIETMNFPNGSLFMDALSTGQIDLGYVGPGPALNRYLQGGEVVLIGNSSKGENVLIARKDADINSIKDLEGKVVATPSTGCTHDLLFRKMLKENGMATEENGGKVKRIPQKPATMIGLFQQKQIDAAVVSEPWASMMESEGIVKVIKEANEVPWEGKLPATVLVASKDFVDSNSKALESFLNAHGKSIDFINNNREETIDIIGKQIKEITNQEIDKGIIKNSLARVTFDSTVDKNILQEFADLSKELGFIEGSSDLSELFWDNLE